MVYQNQPSLEDLDEKMGTSKRPSEVHTDVSLVCLPALKDWNDLKDFHPSLLVWRVKYSGNINTSSRQPLLCCSLMETQHSSLQMFAEGALCFLEGQQHRGQAPTRTREDRRAEWTPHLLSWNSLSFGRHAQMQKQILLDKHINWEDTNTIIIGEILSLQSNSLLRRVWPRKGRNENDRVHSAQLQARRSCSASCY